MSNSNITNFIKQSSSMRPTNGCQAVGDGAFSTDMTPNVLAVCHMQGTDSMYYYSTTFSGGPGVSNLDFGGFDTPTAKCPPDRGSPDWVTDRLASMIPSPYSDNSATSSYGTNSLTDSIIYPPTPPEANLSTYPLAPLSPGASAPRAILGKHVFSADLTTPPLTPDDDGGDGGITAISAKQSNDALDFLSALFPRNALGALSYAKSVSISSPSLGNEFEGVVLELPGKPKTLYVDGKRAAQIDLRESIVALLDLADERLECGALVIALERSLPELGDLLHSLLYVGGNVVTKPPFQVDSAYVLVGMEI